MRTVVYFLPLLFCLVSCPHSWAQNQEYNVPDNRFEAKRIDYGDVLYLKDSTYVYRFVYENTGSAPLILNKVIGHCPCVTVSHSTDPLSPGGRDTLTVYFKPAHASKYSQQITVFSNASRSVISLYAKGNFMMPSDFKTEEP